MIYCPKCGAQSSDQSTACSACGAALANPYQSPGNSGAPPQINNYLIPAIASTVCCCMPFGIVAIVYAAQVNALLAAGNIDRAQKTAATAKHWFWVAVISGLTIQILYLLFVVGMGVAGNLAPNP